MPAQIGRMVILNSLALGRARRWSASPSCRWNSACKSNDLFGGYSLSPLAAIFVEADEREFEKQILDELRNEVHALQKLIAIEPAGD